MKKKLAILLICAVFLPAFASFAENPGEHIIFRNIPWGSSYQEVVNALSKTGLKWSSPAVKTGRTIRNTIIDNIGYGFDYETGVYINTDYKSPQLNVAGYDTTRITLYFAYTTDKNGDLPKDLEHTAFCLAKYEFEPTDLSAMTEDFIMKISALYGEVDEMLSDTLVIENNYFLWYDNDRNIVGLENELYPITESKNIYISYGWGEGDSILQRANDIQYAEALAEEAKKFGTDNLDGL